MKVGYARVSTHDQNLLLQKDALKKAGCEKIIHDQVSGAKVERPGLQEAKAYVRQGDTLVVWRLDRLGHSLKHLIETVTALEERGVGFQSLQESIDTTTSGGRLVFHIFGALAEFERNLIRERTRAGLAAARARGRKGGRSRALDEKKTQLLYQLYDERKHTVKEICYILDISRSTLYAYLCGRRKLKGASRRWKNPDNDERRRGNWPLGHRCLRLLSRISFPSLLITFQDQSEPSMLSQPNPLQKHNGRFR